MYEYNRRCASHGRIGHIASVQIMRAILPGRGFSRTDWGALDWRRGIASV
jgi:hypothetical protein